MDLAAARRELGRALRARDDGRRCWCWADRRAPSGLGPLLAQPEQVRRPRRVPGRSSCPSLTAHGRLLGDALAQHARLHALRPQPDASRSSGQIVALPTTMIVFAVMGVLDHQRHRRSSSARRSGTRSSCVAQFDSPVVVAISMFTLRGRDALRRTSPPTWCRRPTTSRTPSRADHLRAGGLITGHPRHR